MRREMKKDPSSVDLGVNTKRFIVALITPLLLTLMINIRVVSAQTFLFTFGTEGSGNGQFEEPLGVTVDSGDNIYISDTGNNRIQKFDSDGNFILTFGSFGNGDGEFDSPSGVAVDSGDNIYVSDTGNNRIQKFNSNGEFILMWGFGVVDGSNEFQICTSNCQEGIAGSDDGQFLDPFGIAADSSDNIYVSDTGNNRIQKFNSDGDFILTFGSFGNGDGEFDSPSGVAVDSGDNIYVSDTGNNRIQKFDSDTDFILKFGSEGTNFGQFEEPLGVTVDNGNNVYVSDTGNNRIQKFDSIGRFQVMWGFGVKNGSDKFQTCRNSCEEGIAGNGEGQFNFPVGVNGTGNIYVADSENNRVQVFRINVQLGDVPGFSCSMASLGSTPSVPLYLLFPVFILIRKLWRRYRN
jgi:DNA-binding beta-propeller fold protein YncE